MFVKYKYREHQGSPIRTAHFAKVCNLIFPTQIPIPHWRSTSIRFECFCEVAWGEKAEIIGDEGERFIAITEELF